MPEKRTYVPPPRSKSDSPACSRAGFRPARGGDDRRAGNVADGVGASGPRGMYRAPASDRDRGETRWLPSAIVRRPGRCIPRRNLPRPLHRTAPAIPGGICAGAAARRSASGRAPSRRPRRTRRPAVAASAQRSPRGRGRARRRAGSASDRLAPGRHHVQVLQMLVEIGVDAVDLGERCLVQLLQDRDT